MKKNRSLDTLLSHSDYAAPDGFAAFPVPVHHASTVLFENVAATRVRKERGKVPYTYGLHGTPTTLTLQARLAEIEGGTNCILAPSGLAAITLVNFGLLKTGDDMLVPDNVYGPNRAMCDWMAADLGISARYYDPMIGKGIADLIQPNTRLIWTETPGSQTMEIPDITAICHVAKAHQIPVVVDSTWAAGIAYRPLEHGADIVLHALTKYQSGGSDVLMGAIITQDDALHARLDRARMLLGMGIGPEDAFLILRGLPSMKVRYEAHDRSARKIAAWLKARPEIAKVLHPAFDDCPGHDIWKRDYTGAGGLFSVLFDPKYTEAQTDCFVDSLQLFKIGYSWGGSHSLAVPYRVADMRINWTEKGELVRLNIGLEDPDDLIADLEQALETLKS